MQLPRPEQEDAPIISDSMMGSRLPDSVRGSNRGRLSLYHTFMEPERSFGNPSSPQNRDQPSNLANNATPQELDY